MRKLVNKENIILIALKEFSNNGYQNASTNKIAKKSNVSKGTIFNHFKNKSNLFLTVMNYSIRIFRKAVNDFEIKAETPDEIVMEAIYFMQKFYEDNSEIYNLYLQSVYAENIPCKNEIKRVVKIFTTSITLKIIQRMRNLSLIEIKQKDIDLLVYYLNALISRLVETHFFEAKSPFKKNKDLKKIVSFITHGIINKEENFENS